MEIIVNTQAELDAAIAAEHPEYADIYVEGGGPYSRLKITADPKNGRLIIRGSSHAELWGSSHAELWGSSHAVLRGSSRAVLWGSSHAVLRESSHAVLWGSSHAELWGSSHAVLWGSSHAVLWGSSHAELWGSSHAVLWGSSHAVLRESSHADAHANAVLHVQSVDATAELFGVAVALLVAAAKKIVKRSRTASIIRGEEPRRGVGGWLEREGVSINDGTVIVYKRVSRDWKTQEGTIRETSWAPGTTQTHAAWDPTAEECGPGKFHACGRAYLCDDFRSTADDRYVAIAVAKKDLHAWDGGQYPHKIAFRKGTVLHEVDRFGRKIAASARTAR